MKLSAGIIIKTFIFTSSAIICFIQCYGVLNNFFLYPLDIDVSERSANLMGSLPSLTICNNNRLSLNKIMFKYPRLMKEVVKNFPANIQQKITQHEQFTKFRNIIARIYEKLNYSTQDELDTSTMKDLFDLKPENFPFLTWVGCARTWSDTLECGKLSQIDSIQDRRCITILNRGALSYDLVHNRHLFNASKSSIDEFESFFDYKEILKIVLDFQPEDYADLKRQIGARIIFHQNNFVGSSIEPDFFVTRGYRYEFSIDRHDGILLSKPYDNCYDYEENNLHLFENGIDPRVPLNIHTCVQSCVVKNMIAIFNCWPPTIPYFRNDSLDPDLNVKSCAWANYNVPIFEKMGEVEGSSTLVRSFKKLTRHCYGQCVLSCKFSRYSVSVTKTIWPSDVEIVFDENGNKQKMRHCCAIVIIKMNNRRYKVQKFKPKYNLEDMIGDIGGLLAVWLGISIISIYHAIQKLIDLCNHGAFRSTRTWFKNTVAI